MTACISRGPKATPASQHSPASHATTISQQQQQYNQIIKIYTEWGNHYLEKARFKRLIQNLQTDLNDGILLADVVEAVCSQRVADINRKPKSPVNMIENIVNCLTLLEHIGVALDGIIAKDIRDGNLKTVLGLFFALSKYKQQQKQRQAIQAGQESQNLVTTERLQQKRQHLAPLAEEMKQTRLPSPYYNQQTALAATNGVNTSIPTPISHRPSRAIAPGINSLKCSISTNSSRSVSPSHSFIPTPKSGLNARSSLNEKQLMSGKSGNKIVNGGNLFGIPPISGKASMIEKVRSLNPKEKNKSAAINSSDSSINSTKRTSSSSGVSSTRSEKSSDSSNSLCNEIRSFNAERKENVSFANDLKSAAKKKVIVKPTEIRAIKLPMKPTSFKSDERSQLSIQELAQLSNKEDNKLSMAESRLSSSGIPKPTAAVKGTTKPTNSVAPMPIAKPTTEIEEKNSMKADTIVEEKTSSRNSETSNKANNGDYSKQSSICDEDEAVLLNIKPMEPLLRGYRRNIVLPRRISSTSNMCNLSRVVNGHCGQQYSSRFDSKKVSECDDFDVTSGYVSDGDVLHNNISMSTKFYNHSDVDGGYVSEGGAQMYQRYSNNWDLKLHRLNKRSDTAIKGANLSSIGSGQNLKQILNDRGQSTDVLTALASGSPLHKFGHKLNGRGLGPEEGPVSPPEPTPTHGGSYAASYSVSSPHFSPPESTPVVYRLVTPRSHVKKADSGQQTENTAYNRHVVASNGPWRKYSECDTSSGSARTSDLMNNEHLRSARNGECSENVRIREKRSPSAAATNACNTGSLLRNKCEKQRISSTSSSREELIDSEFYNGERKCRSDSKNKVKNVPSNFGYVKRSNSNSSNKESRTAQVSAVPRTKVKVSGGTQTDMKSYSLNSTAANQLSQSVRERILMGADVIAKSSSRNPNKAADRDSLAGSLSDSTYTDLQILSNHAGSWFRQGSPYTASLPTRSSAVVGLLDSESIESLPAQFQHRASLTNTRLLTGSTSPAINSQSRLSRSNSISYLRERTFPRSTKSEKLYPSMLQRSDELEPLYSTPYGLGGACNKMSNSQNEPPSPTPSHLSQATSVGNSSRYHYVASPSSSSQGYSRNSPYMNFLTKMNSKEDDVHGSAMSLVSTASSSLYSTQEDKQTQEVRRLRRDLGEAQQKVHSLTSKISTNAHVVSAFEKSLSSMTLRIQQLTATIEKKESELSEAYQTIELLRKQSAENGSKEATPTHNNCSPSLTRRHTINTTIDSNTGNNISRQLSTDSVSSLVSVSSACSLSSGNQVADMNILDKNNKKKRGWLRSSFSKAFSRSKKNRNGSVSDIEDSRTTQSDMSAPSSPLLNSPHAVNGSGSDECKSCVVTNMKNSHSSSALYDGCNERAIDDNECSPEVVMELKKKLREKELMLTDSRLEVLSSAHQLESLKDAVTKMKNDMLLLIQDRERLQRIVTSKSLASSQCSLQTHDSLDRRYSTADVAGDRIELDSSFAEHTDSDAKKVCVRIFLGCHGSYHKYVDERSDRIECPISLIPVSATTSWESLDALVLKAFKEYLDRMDVGSNLGLTRDSIWSYHVGEIVRYKDSEEPELLPCGYLVGGAVSSITVCLKGAFHNGCLDALAIELLIPVSIIQRYVNLLSEHRRVMFYGPNGTGKTNLAHKIAEYLLYSEGKEVSPNSIVTFSIDEKSTKDLRQYLSNLAEQCENNNNNCDLNSDNGELPSVIILDNLHAASCLSDVLNNIVNIKSDKYSPYVIGTLNQSNGSFSNLQLHHNFRWILYANHMEPIKGFLGRYLRRRLIEIECKREARNPELCRIIEWIPKVQQHLNKFLETHVTADVTIGPKLFMSCPMEVDGSQVWFTDLWNYSLVPYLLDAVRDGLQQYGKRAPWEDPAHFVIRNYPWSKSASVHGGIESLMRLRPEDVGYEVQHETDPLLNMLMTLQEAANYSSSSHSNESESVPNDSLPAICANSTI